MKPYDLQFLRETINQQRPNMEPAYNITFNELEALYRKVSCPGNALEALADAFIFGYAMGQKAARKEAREKIN